MVVGVEVGSKGRIKVSRIVRIKFKQRKMEGCLNL